MRFRILLPLLICAAALNAQITTILNGASFQPEIAAGSWATAFGAFAGVTQTTGTTPVTTSLGGVTMTVGGVPAPIYYVSSSQINFIVPMAATAGLQPLQIKVGSNTYDATIRILSTAPGLFSQDTATPPKGAVLNQNFSLNTSSAVALRGEVVQIYATGPGAFKSPVTDGGAAPSNPLTQTQSTPQVFVDGVQAEVAYSGLAPGFAALWQINVKIPNQTFITSRVPVVVYMDGVSSNEVTIFVQ